jgi:hypothetical protein
MQRLALFGPGLHFLVREVWASKLFLILPLVELLLINFHVRSALPLGPKELGSILAERAGGWDWVPSARATCIVHALLDNFLLLLVHRPGSWDPEIRVANVAYPWVLLIRYHTLLFKFKFLGT